MTGPYKLPHMLLRSYWATSTSMLFSIFFCPTILKWFFKFQNNKKFINFRIIVNLYNKLQPYLETVKKDFTKDFEESVGNRNKRKGQSDNLNFSHLSALLLRIVSRTIIRFEILLYSFTSFQPKENQNIWNHEGEESDTVWTCENLPTFLLHGFALTIAYLTSFLPVFLSSQ